MKQLEASDLPRTARIIMVMVERIGFPIMACGLMFYIGATSLKKIEIALVENSRAMTSFIGLAIRFQDTVLVDHRKMMEDVQELKKAIQ